MAILSAHGKFRKEKRSDLKIRWESLEAEIKRKYFYME